ncbi:MAG: lactate utilization protein [Acidimicrobiia bacterium]
MRRDAFLSRVARSTLTADLPEPPAVTADLPDLDEVDAVALFRARAQDVDTVVHGPVSRHGAARAVAAIATGHNKTSFMAWDDLGVSGVVSTLTAAGLDRVDHHVPRGERRAHNQSYLNVGVGVTGSDGALAESGSLILAHGEGRPRMASLVPDIHIALLDTAKVARTISHWARQNVELAVDTTNLVLITGPSRTGDIEQELNLGVHGPRHVHVVIIR